MRRIKLAAVTFTFAALVAGAGLAPPPSGNENLALGNPSDASADAARTPDNFLIERPQFVLSYNNTKKIPNWVSWHLSKKWLGSEGRKGVFHPDDDLPSNFVKVTPADYSHTGFDKGHMCPSADRTTDFDDNNALFTMINMVPQAPDNNRKTWEHLETTAGRSSPRATSCTSSAAPPGWAGPAAAGSATRSAARRRSWSRPRPGRWSWSSPMATASRRSTRPPGRSP